MARPAPAGHRQTTPQDEGGTHGCGHMNFFTSHSTAAAWARGHPEIIGGILSQGRALEVGQQAFGQLLH
ncbi:MAG: organomercurial lyase [Streptosporangiaceae bacterium]